MKVFIFFILFSFFFTNCHSQNFNIKNNDISIWISIRSLDATVNLSLKYYNLTKDTLLVEEFRNNNIILNLTDNSLVEKSESAKLLYIYRVPYSDIFVPRLKFLYPKDSIFFEQRIDTSKFNRFKTLWFEFDYFNLSFITNEIGNDYSPIYKIKNNNDVEVLSIDKKFYFVYNRSLFFESELR